MINYVNKKNTRFKSVHSGGPGGQNVNKRSTKVQVWVKVDNLELSFDEKQLIREKLSHHINKNDEIEVYSEEERSQEQNYERAVERINEMIREAIKIHAPRIPTKVSESYEEKFREERRLRSLKKKHRHIAKNLGDAEE